jgi:hypothetical protein
MTAYAPISQAHQPDGHVVRWAVLDSPNPDSSSLESPLLDTTVIRWENEGYTVSGQLDREQVEYVVRISASWQVRQFILFRDLEEPDLWLATDGAGRWGEMNGAHRTELDGCYDVHLACAAFTVTLPIRRLPLLDGHTAELPVVVVDTETLEVRAVTHRYTRLGVHRWRIETDDPATTAEVEVDDHGLVLDHPGRFRRLS